MKLPEALLNIQDSPEWAVYADGKTADSDARYGRVIFENGGLFDGKFLIMNGAQANRAALQFVDGDLDLFDDGHVDADDFFNWLVEVDWIST